MSLFPALCVFFLFSKSSKKVKKCGRKCRPLYFSCLFSAFFLVFFSILCLLLPRANGSIFSAAIMVSNSLDVTEYVIETNNDKDFTVKWTRFHLRSFVVSSIASDRDMSQYWCQSTFEKLCNTIEPVCGRWILFENSISCAFWLFCFKYASNTLHVIYHLAQITLSIK